MTRPIYRRRFFTPNEIIKARAMRHEGYSWRDLATTFNCDYATIRRAIEPRYAELRAQQIAATKKGERVKSLGQREQVKSKIVPEDVLADRDRRSNALRSLTALFCGDPAPGQSALDKRGPTA